MKKYFFLIAFLTVVFLWLGNYSFAQINQCVWMTCHTGVPTLVDWSCQCVVADAGTQTSSTSTTDSTTNWTPCTSGMSSNLAWKDNAIVSLGGLWCTCKDGYKEVDNVCKSCKAEWVCCWISLNTSVPFIGNCIEDSTANQGPGETNVTWDTAFPVLMWSLTKILVTIILIVSFVLIIIWGIMIATGNPGGKKMIIRVVVGIALLGASGVILRLINPNFFG